MKKIVLTCLIALVLAGGAMAQSAGKFGSSTQKTVAGKTIRVPYTQVTDYAGCVAPGAPAEEEKGGKKYYYLYVWIPAVAPEIGIAMISPGNDLKEYKKAKFKGPDLDKCGPGDYFDTWVTLERAATIVNPEQVTEEGIAQTNWLSYGSNDDDGDLRAQPSGSKYNSILRVKSEVSNPVKALVRGLYRIGFTTYKVGEVKGSFLARVAAPVKIPGVLVAPKAELIKQLKEAKK